MKKILLLVMFCVLSLVGKSQDKIRFDYKIDSGHHTYTVSPLFDSPKGECKKGLPSFNDDDYLNNLVFKVVFEVLSKTTLNQLHRGSFCQVTFNSRGEVLYCKFFINDKDRYAITENDLYDLYSKFKQVKIDTSKFTLLPSYASTEKHPDCADVYVPLVPK